jgi:uncharacterized membrane protein YfcA
MTKRKNQPLHKYLRFAGAGFQMGATIFIFYKIGAWLDTKYPNENELYTKIITLLGVFLSIYMVVKEAIKLSKEND